jgi:hypothetical protein
MGGREGTEMTEAEWQAADSPDSMLKHIWKEANVRKSRLFACSCCRQVWHLLPNPSRSAVAVAERYADGLANDEELAMARRSHRQCTAFKQCRSAAKVVSAALLVELSEYVIASPAEERREPPHPGVIPYSWALMAYREATEALAGPRFEQGQREPDWEVWHSARRFQCSFLRDLFGNPFRPVALEQHWLSSKVLDLARLIYDERAFDHLPIFADALMDAGCDNDDILSHCRSEGPHVRGCWVIDLLLGKK